MARKKGFDIRNLILARKNRRGQIWVETVIYTLIAFTLIGLVLAFVKPEIEKIQDKSLIDQSVEVLQEIDSVVRNIGSAGNQRVLRLGINKGTLNIDGAGDKILFDIESRHAYSEPGENVTNGNVIIQTSEVGSAYRVNLTIYYSTSYNITFQGSEELRKIGRASTPYRLSISNDGLDSESLAVIDFNTVN